MVASRLNALAHVRFTPNIPLLPILQIWFSVSLMRYCSARRIAPTVVDEAVIDGYMRYRAETTALASNDAARDRTMIRISRLSPNLLLVGGGWIPAELPQVFHDLIDGKASRRLPGRELLEAC
jgi:hypothetical protein